MQECQVSVDRRAKGRVDLGGEQVDMWPCPQDRFRPRSCLLEGVVMLYYVMANMAEKETEGRMGGGVFLLVFFGFFFIFTLFERV